MNGAEIIRAEVDNVTEWVSDEGANFFEWWVRREGIREHGLSILRAMSDDELDILYARFLIEGEET